ncbi:hypothetical protein Tco_0645054, partial [Tanacetum coccineum]
CWQYAQTFVVEVGDKVMLEVSSWKDVVMLEVSSWKDEVGDKVMLEVEVGDKVSVGEEEEDLVSGSEIGVGLPLD